MTRGSPPCRLTGATGPSRKRVTTVRRRKPSPIELKPGEAGGPATVIDYRGSYDDYVSRESEVLAAA